MEKICKGISYVGLAATVIPAFLVFSGAMALETNKIIMAIGMVLWFVTAPVWLKK